MFGVYITVPIACFRKGLAREYLETEMLPPPATCYGFLLSLVGETQRRRHVGCRVAPGILNQPAISVVLRTIWRLKNKDAPLGSGNNARPDYQQLLTGPSAGEPFIRLIVWLDSSQESAEGDRLEVRVRRALMNPSNVSRFGGLSLGESTHLVDSVDPVEHPRCAGMSDRTGRVFIAAERGRMTLPVWVDHVGSAKTCYVTGDLVDFRFNEPPPLERMPQIPLEPPL